MITGDGTGRLTTHWERRIGEEPDRPEGSRWDHGVRFHLRRVFTVLCVITAIGGGIWGGKVLFQTLKSRDAIDTACDGLVPAGRVLALSQSDGRVRAKQEGPLTPDGAGCVLYSDYPAKDALGEAAEGQRRFLTASAGTGRTLTAQPEHVHHDYTWDWWGTLKKRAQPVGGYIDAVYDDSEVRVVLPCRVGELKGRPVNELWASVTLYAPTGGQVKARDRRVLTEIAVGTVNNLSQRAGCERQWAMPDDSLPREPLPAPVPVDRAEGTCRFARALTGPHTLDQAIAARTSGHTSEEGCALIASRSRASHLWNKALEGRSPHDRPDREAQYWADLRSVTGERAQHVTASEYGFDDIDHDVPLPAGKAGRAPEEVPIWWASSKCPGGIAVHTLSLASPYGSFAAPAWQKTFRAYVDDYAERRHCKVTAFPAADTFH